MSASTALATPSPRGATNPWFIAVVVSLASFMEVLDTTIANVALRYIAGGLGVGPDEASWVVTTYLVANAIILPTSTFFARRLGRKRFYLGCLALFTISSILCGTATSLNELLLFRMLQGFAGGGMVPIAQSILADAFPPEKRGQAFALFGVAVVVAPVVGPTLGGWLSDNLSWHWSFLINGPVGLVTFALVAWVLPATPPAGRGEAGPRFDLAGFVLVAGFLGALELVLDRGVIEDWFGSPLIVTCAAVSLVCFLLMIPWELTRADPLIDLRMFASRQFASCFVVMLATGGILIATTQFLPQLLQTYYGYTATWAGLVLSPGGLVTMAMMAVVGRLSGFVQPRWLIAAGAIVVAIGMLDLTRITSDLDFSFFAESRMLIGVGLPLLFIPITSAAYVGLPPDRIDQASALINVARNVGGSIGVSFGADVLAHRAQFHQDRLVETLTATDPRYEWALRHAKEIYASRGAGAESQAKALAWIGGQLQTQAGLLAYIDLFWTLMLVAAAMVPLALILRRVELGKAGPSTSH